MDCTSNGSAFCQAEQERFQSQAQDTLHQLLAPSSHADHRRAGRRRLVSSQQLWMGLLVCLLQGKRHQRDLWKLMAWTGFWSFPALAIPDQAISKRLAQEGVKCFPEVFLARSNKLAPHVAPYAQTHLAPFAKLVVALDETTLDQMAQKLAP